MQYAPELNFSGAAVGGLPTNVSNLLDAVTGAFYAGLIPSGLLGGVSQYPEAYDYLLGKLKPTGLYNATTFLPARYLSAAQANEVFGDQDVFQYFIDGRADLQAPIIQKIFDNDGLMGYHGVPQMPLFVYKAIADALSTTNQTDAFVNKYCAVGANLLYQRNTMGGHLAEYYNGVPGAFDWLSSVLNGSYSLAYPTQGCTIQNVIDGSDTSPV